MLLIPLELMRITILTQYYPPETGAPQNRLHSLARNLKAAGHHVEVQTGMPNYPKMRVFEGYRRRLFHFEKIDGIEVRRSWIFVTRSKSIFPRLLNYFSFVFSSLISGIRAKSVDYVFCESPPLFLGISAWLIAKVRGAQLIFNVSDLWPESAEKLGIVGEGLPLRMAYRLEAWLYRKSFLVTGQTQGIVNDIKVRFPNVSTIWLPNGIDEDVVANVERDTSWRKQYGVEGKKVFIYAGVLGHAQGLEVIIMAAKRLRSHEEIAFVIVGDGPLSEDLQELNRNQEAGVVFIPNTPKQILLGMVADVYAYIVPLKKLDLFKGAIPSKLFDPLGFGVPILLGVEGEAKSLFIDDARAGLAFEPENDEELALSVIKFVEDPEGREQMGRNGLEYVGLNFDRRVIAERLIDKLEN